MKKILTVLLFAATSAGAQAVLTTAPEKPEPFYGTTELYLESPVYYSSRLDCEPYETFTPWVAKSEGSATKTLHQHEWVYAEREDVNHAFFDVTVGWKCPCGCPTTENQARICEACFRHEWRTREYGQRPKEKEKSRYLRLVEGVKE